MSRFTPHAQTLPDTRTQAQVTAEGRRLLLLIREPRPDIRKAGDDAWEADRERWSNPYAEDTAEFVNWDSGWMDAKLRNK